MKTKLQFLLLWGFLALVSFAARGQDIILDPIEQNPVQPSARSLAVGNWGYGALIGSNASEIARRATRPVVVYVFDTGGRYDHPGLQKAAWNEKGRIFTGEPDGGDGNGHSTHVASSYAGVDPGGAAVGICDGLLSKGLIRIVPLKVLSNGGSGSFSYSNAALDAVLQESRDLIRAGTFVVYNFSLGGGTAVLADTERRLQAARDAGVFIAAAAGNSGGPGVIYPASGNAAHAIAAVNSSLTKASFSTTGAEVWGATPGQSIYGCWPPNLYRELSGTSMATPHMGAVAALIGSVYPTATAEQVRAHIETYSRDLGSVGRDSLYGFGFPNITAMLANAPGGEPDPDPEPGCKLNAPEISTACNNAGTPTDPSDDRYSYSIRVTGSNTSANYYILESAGSVREMLPYGTTQGPFGPFPISGGNVSITVFDTQDSGCKVAGAVRAPAPCSSTPDPEPGPARTQTIKISKTYTVPFNTVADPKNRMLKFRIDLAYTHTKRTDQAVKDLTALTDEHFRQRGYTLRAGDDEWEAAYWVAFFFELIDGKKIGARVTRMVVNLGSGEVDRTEFVKPSRVKLRTATLGGAVTWTY